MRIIVHRGAEEIGGSCIEISTGKTRVVLDAGLPLTAEPSVTTPRVSGLFTSGPSVDGVFLSHAHADHAGLIAASNASVPVWLSDGTRQMLFAGDLFARLPNIPRNRLRRLMPTRTVVIGDIKVTPYQVDHSVYDSMAFLLEAGGKRVLYSGDLRFHGRKPGMARSLVAAIRGKSLDALLVEGTRLGPRAAEENLSERELERLIVDEISKGVGCVLAMYSPLNVDRFVTFFRAARRTGRIMVIDPYQAMVLHLIRRASLPVPDKTADLQVMVPPGFDHTGAGRRLARTAWRRTLGGGHTGPTALLQSPDRYVLLFRPSMRDWLFGPLLPPRTLAIFSYWSGYLREKRTASFAESFAKASGRFIPLHASGHAHVSGLVAFVRALKPQRIIPVHTEHAGEWGKWFSSAAPLRNGQALDLP